MSSWKKEGLMLIMLRSIVGLSVMLQPFVSTFCYPSVHPASASTSHKIRYVKATSILRPNHTLHHTQL
jgi:hypothetical protein